MPVLGGCHVFILKVRSMEEHAGGRLVKSGGEILLIDVRTDVYMDVYMET